MPAQVDFTLRPKTIETHLADGAPVCLRPVRPSDEEAIEQGIRDLSDRSRYLRFFSSFRSAPPSVVERLSAADGFDHIAWGAVMTGLDGEPPVAAGHAIRDVERPDTADLAIAVLDDFHHRGIARLLIAALGLDCRHAALTQLRFEVLHENKPAIALVKSLGARAEGTVGVVMTYSLDIAEMLDRLKAMPEPPGLEAVFSAFKGPDSA
ncbi:MAG: GNAT family N-acetyltransferase [Parasphingopyxis sp.]|uniref:GNAT family N-acetyltransferase n=1 Tax=Parasphingopyxis sp. TaxID=1920299 RepID=UPI0032EA9633